MVELAALPETFPPPSSSTILAAFVDNNIIYVVLIILRILPQSITMNSQWACRSPPHAGQDSVLPFARLL